MKIVFFIVFYLLLGTAGIWLPWLVNRSIVPSEVAIGLVTVVVSAVSYSSSERILQIIEEKSFKKGPAFVNMVALVLALLFTLVVCILKDLDVAVAISIIVYILSCVFWWFQNKENKNIENPSTSTLGGDVSQFNK